VQGFGAQPPERRRRGLRIFLIIVGSLVGLVLLAVIGGLFAAERIANKAKDKAMAELSIKLGRPVSAGPIEVKVLGGGRFMLSNVVIGKDPKIPGDPDPAVRLDRAYVNVALLPIITSLGKRMVVQDVAVEGLAVQVASYADGRTNLQDIAEKAADEAKKDEPDATPPVDEETRAIARGAKLERLRLTDARLRFVDLARNGAAVEISDLDVVVDNLSLVAPFQAQISAAILAAKKNFDFRASFGAAPDRPGEIAPPPLEQVTVKLEPTALAPLGPFLAAALRGSGLEEITEGNLAIDLQAVPGAAAPGGAGPTTLKGFLALAGAKFAGGETFEARLDSDLAADVAAGSVDIKRFAAKLGEMVLEAKGQIAELAGAQPKVEGFMIESRGFDFTRIKAYYPPLDKTAGVLLRGPFSVAARGQGQGENAQLNARVDLTAASMEVPGQFRKPAGTTLTLELKAAARQNLLRAERIALTMAKWTLLATGSLRTQGTGKAARQSFEGTLDAPTMPVRELVALLAPKSLADVPDVRVAAKVTAQGTVGNPASMKVEVPAFSVQGGKSDLAGKLSLANLEAPRVSFDGRAKYLDVDDFLPASAKSTARPASPAGKGAPGGQAGKPGQAGKEAEPPEMLKKLEGTAKMVVERGRAAEIDYQNMRADLTVKNGRLTARTLEVDALGGHFSGAGSEFPLVEKKDSFAARGEVTGLDIAAALAQFADKRNLLAGRLSAKIDLSGSGVEPDLLKQSLTGKLSGRLAEAQFMPASLLGPVASSIADAAAKLPIGKAVKAAADKAAAVKDRRLGTLAGALRFAGGAMETVKPLEAQTPSGPMSVGGKISLEGIADMIAKLELSPATASALTGGKVSFDKPVPVELHIGGPISKPQIRPADPAALGKVFLAALGRSAVGEAVKARANEALERAGAGRAKEAGIQAATQAQAQAEERRRQAEAEAAQRTAEARRVADEQAQRARQEADEKAKAAKEAAGKKLKGIFGR
jgi:hypothetical protein